MWRHVVWSKCTDVSDKPTTSIGRRLILTVDTIPPDYMVSHLEDGSFRTNIFVGIWSIDTSEVKWHQMKTIIAYGYTWTHNSEAYLYVMSLSLILIGSFSSASKRWYFENTCVLLLVIAVAAQIPKREQCISFHNEIASSILLGTCTVRTLFICFVLSEARGGAVVETLRYKPEGRGIDSFMRRARWKTYGVPQRARFIANYLVVL
jgi:hypothetical protein